MPVNDTYPTLMARVLNAATTLRASAVNLRSAAQASTMTGAALIQFHDQALTLWKDYDLLVADGADINTLATSHFLNAYRPVDTAAFLAGGKTATLSTLAWVEANTPKDGAGYLLLVRFDGADNASNWRVFSAGQVTGLVTELDALIAALTP